MPVMNVNVSKQAFRLTDGLNQTGLNEQKRHYEETQQPFGILLRVPSAAG